MPTASRRTLRPWPVRRVVSLRWFFGGLLCFIAILTLLFPFAGAASGFFCVTLAVVVRLIRAQERRRQAKIVAFRGGESICTFVRGFDYRRLDTRVLRAIFEELQPVVDFPLRADDYLEDDLHLYDEDLDWDIAPVIAHRTGRSLQDTKHNPYYGRVRTVADLVAFFCAQPLAPTTVT